MRDPSRAPIPATMSENRLFDLSAIKRALIEGTGPGKQWSRRGLSLAIGMGPDWVRDVLSGRNKTPSAEAVAGVAEKLNLPIGTFFSMEPVRAGEPRQIPVVGKVAAGVWREPGQVDEAEKPLLSPFDPPMWAHGRRFALRVEGQSMNKVFTDGSYLDCIDVISAGMTPSPGQYVVVERCRGELRETTAKLLARREDGEWELRAESTLPEFSEPIPIGHPSLDHYIDSETRILGVVVGNYRPYL